MVTRIWKAILKGLEVFAKWFTSAAGVVQTFVVVAALCIFELTGRVKDTHGFWLLYWLTVYSAITQPALAYVAKNAGDQQQETDARLEAINLKMLALLEHHGIELSDESLDQ